MPQNDTPPGYYIVQMTLVDALANAKVWPDVLRVADALRNIQALISEQSMKAVETPRVANIAPTHPLHSFDDGLANQAREDGVDLDLPETFGRIPGETSGPMFRAQPHGVDSEPNEWEYTGGQL